MGVSKKAWANLAFYILMIATNAFANLFKLGGGSTGEVSAKYGNVLTPAGWTFAIWGAIYALLLVPVLGPLFKPEGKTSQLMAKLKGWFAISCIMNIIWIISWHLGNITISFIAIIGLLATLFMMFAKYSAPGDLISEKIVGWDNAGLSVYFGWICVATLANAMVLLVSKGLDGYGSTAQIMSAIILILGSTTIMLLSVLGNWIIAATGIWAYSGILYNQIAPTELDGKYKIVTFSAILGIWILATGAMMSIATITRQRKLISKTA